MPFQMPEIRQSNALAMISNIRQQRTANALADRQVGLQEAQGRRAEAEFNAAQQAAQRARVEAQMKNVAMALYRMPEGARAQGLQALQGDPRFADLPPQAWQFIGSNPQALTTQNLSTFLNAGGDLTPEQLAADKRRMAEAEAKPEVIVTYGADGKTPVRRAFNPYGPELAAGVTDAPDAEAAMTDARTRAENAANRALTREGWRRADARAADAARAAAAVAGAPQADKPTESARLSRGFLMRMQNADTLLSRLAIDGVDPSSLGSVVSGASNYTASPGLQMYRQAANDWIRAKLRRESGASIAPDEMEREFETYFPVYGDSPEVIQQKAEARAIATQGMMEAAALPSTQASRPNGGWSIEPAR